jgi:hypothetical protein
VRACASECHTRSHTLALAAPQSPAQHHTPPTHTARLPACLLACIGALRALLLLLLLPLLLLWPWLLLQVLLIQFCLSAPKTDMDNTVVVSEYEQMDRILKAERKYLLKLCKAIKKTGCNVLLIQKSILRDAYNSLSMHLLAKLGARYWTCYHEGLLACRRTCYRC